MHFDRLKLITVMLLGEADDTHTCFNAVEVQFTSLSAKPADVFQKKPNGFEGVVYTKHPVDLKHLFGRGLIWAEIDGPQSVYFIYPPGEAVSVNKLIDQMAPLIKREFPGANAIFHFTQRYSFVPEAPDCTFLKEFSSHLAVNEHNTVTSDSSFYHSGNVIDIVLNKDGRTLFTSIFIGVEMIKYRLAVLGAFISDEEVEGKMNGGIRQHKDDKIIEEGEFKPSADPVADAAKIVKWMRILVEKE